MFENVMCLSRLVDEGGFLNLDWCVHLLGADCDMHAFIASLCPRLCGFPVTRNHLFLHAVLRKHLHESGLSVGEADEVMKRVLLQLFPGMDLRPIDEFLLPESHPVIQKAFHDNC